MEHLARLPMLADRAMLSVLLRTFPLIISHFVNDRVFYSGLLIMNLGGRSPETAFHRR
jgi:hypothetical protein